MDDPERIVENLEENEFKKVRDANKWYEKNYDSSESEIVPEEIKEKKKYHHKGSWRGVEEGDWYKIRYGSMGFDHSEVRFSNNLNEGLNLMRQESDKRELSLIYSESIKNGEVIDGEYNLYEGSKDNCEVPNVKRTKMDDGSYVQDVFTFHTHPEGHAFSGQDIASLAESKLNAEGVITPDGDVYLIRRNPDSPKFNLIDKADGETIKQRYNEILQEEKWKLRNQSFMKGLHELKEHDFRGWAKESWEALKPNKDIEKIVSERATQRACDEFGLEFYKGKLGEGLKPYSVGYDPNRRIEDLRR